MIDLHVADLLGWSQRITALAFDVTGTRLVVTGDGGARLYDAGGALIAALPHLDGVNDAAFAPDGARLLTASEDMGVRLWRSADGALLALAKGHLHDVVAVAWSPAGEHFASASLDGTIRTWRLHGDEPVEEEVLRPCERPYGRLRWSGGGWSMMEPDVTPAPEDEVLVRLTCADAVITGERAAVARVWTHGGELIGEVAHDHEVTLLAAPPSGERVASCSRSGTVRIWSPADAAPPRRRAAAPPEPEWADDLGEWMGLALSPDRARLAVSAGARLQIRDVASGAVLVDTGGGEPSSLRWEGTHLLVRTAGDRRCRVYDPSDLRRVTELEPKDVDPDVAGDRLLLRSTGGRVNLYALAAGEPPRLLGEVTGKGVIDTMAPSPDGTRLVIGFRDSGAVLVDLRSAGVIGPVGSAGWGGAIYSPDGAVLLTSGATGVCLWEARTGALRRELGIARGWHAAWSPRGDRVAVADNDGPLHLFDATGRELARHGGSGLISERLSNPSFDPDGTLLCAWHGKQPVKVWDAATGAVHAELSGHAGMHFCVRFLGGQRLLSWEQGGIRADLVRRLWDRDGRLIAPLPGHRGERFFELAVAPDQGWIASTVVGDPAVRLWRTADGEPHGPLGGHRGLPRWALFAGAGRLITGCDAGTLRNWSLPR